jgi:hypothetical protein
VAVTTQNFDDAKVHEDGLPLHVEHNIGRLNIAVHHAALVSISHRIAG